MRGCTERPLSAADEEIGRWTISRPPHLSDLRAVLQELVNAQALSGAADPADLTDRLTVIPTELASNALRHGRPPAVIVVLRCDGHLVVDVADTDAQTIPVAATDRPVSPGCRSARQILMQPSAVRALNCICSSSSATPTWTYPTLL
ncbi:hypothetical protein [Actinoplanes xinjiangensis]|uniref:hypothetical protein n=1 Tax=Actinoplanes xinjiangensis TaxID=512350 RepID=UPI0034420C04